MFEPGQQVVCINDKFAQDINDYYNSLPRKGDVYTVRDIVPGIDMRRGGETASVLLEECNNKPNRHGIEPGFAPDRFAEISPEQQQQIEESTATINAFMQSYEQE